MSMTPTTEEAKTKGQAETPRNKWGEPDHYPIIGHWHVRHQIEAAADTGYMFGKNFARLADAIDFCEQQKGQCRLLCHIDGEGWLRIDRPFQSYYVGAATPAPSSPGVPDSVRAIADRLVVDACELPDRTSPEDQPEMLLITGEELHGFLMQAMRDAISAHPAGQSTGQGAEDPRDAVVEAARCMPRETPAPGGAFTVHDFKIEAANVWALDKALRQFDGQPAPDSTRTGQVEAGQDRLISPKMTPEQEQRIAHNLCGEFGPDAVIANVTFVKAFYDELYAAARPAAPGAQGAWRPELEAFVAREWPKGRSAGAAARELARALGVAGIAPTLLRLLTELLSTINFASTDRAAILADFANAAPEAARAAKLDSFERWNPHVFDPAPPASSGQESA